VDNKKAEKERSEKLRKAQIKKLNDQKNPTEK
jgi:hypothetical protein